MGYYRDRSWVKLIDVTETTVGNRISNHLQSRMVYYLMNTHIKKHNIYICRHGESKFNLEGRVGGDSELTDNGKMVGTNRSARDKTGGTCPLPFSNQLLQTELHNALKKS